MGSKKKKKKKNHLHCNKRLAAFSPGFSAFQSQHLSGGALIVFHFLTYHKWFLFLYGDKDFWT